LLNVLNSLVEIGNTVIVIEHNLDIIRCADWIVDLGPGAGNDGGQVVVAGTVQQVQRCPSSLTGQCLQPHVQCSN
jgi:excinuclease ABC subunit A